MSDNTEMQKEDYNIQKVEKESRRQGTQRYLVMFSGFQLPKTCFGAIPEKVNYHFGAAKQCFGAEGFIVCRNKTMFLSKRILIFEQQNYILECQTPSFLAIPLLNSKFFILFLFVLVCMHAVILLASV